MKRVEGEKRKRKNCVATSRAEGEKLSVLVRKSRLNQFLPIIIVFFYVFTLATDTARGVLADCSCMLPIPYLWSAWREFLQL